MARGKNQHASLSYTRKVYNMNKALVCLSGSVFLNQRYWLGNKEMIRNLKDISEAHRAIEVNIRVLVFLCSL